MSYTRGPWFVKHADDRPDEIEIVGADGDLILWRYMPHSSSRDKSVQECLEGAHFAADVRQAYSAANYRALADATLAASAPDLLEALETLREWALDDAFIRYDDGDISVQEFIDRRIAKARGETR